MNSFKISEKIRIQQPTEIVFDYTQNYQVRLDWDVFLKKAVLLDGNFYPSIGSKAYCLAHNNIGMVVQYISFHRPKTTAVKMSSKSFIFKSFSGSWNFKRISDNSTEVIFIYSVSLRFPFNIFKWVIKNTIKKNIKMRLRTLKINLEKSSYE